MNYDSLTDDRDWRRYYGNRALSKRMIGKEQTSPKPISDEIKQKGIDALRMRALKYVIGKRRR